MIVILGLYGLDCLCREIITFDGRFNYGQPDPRRRASIALNLLSINVAVSALSLEWNTEYHVISLEVLGILILVSIAILIIGFALRRNELKREEQKMCFASKDGNLCRTTSFLFNALSLCVFLVVFYVHWATWFIWIPVILMGISVFSWFNHEFSVQDYGEIDLTEVHVSLIALGAFSAISFICQFFFHSFFGFPLWVILLSIMAVGLVIFFLFLLYKKAREKSRSKYISAAEIFQQEQSKKTKEEELVKVSRLIEQSLNGASLSVDDLSFLYKNIPVQKLVPIFKKFFDSINLMEHVHVSKTPHMKIVWRGELIFTLKLLNEIVKRNYYDDELNEKIIQKIDDLRKNASQYETYSFYGEFIQEIDSTFEYC